MCVIEFRFFKIPNAPTLFLTNPSAHRASPSPSLFGGFKMASLNLLFLSNSTKARPRWELHSVRSFPPTPTFYINSRDGGSYRSVYDWGERPLSVVSSLSPELSRPLSRQCSLFPRSPRCHPRRFILAASKRSPSASFPRHTSWCACAGSLFVFLFLLVRRSGGRSVALSPAARHLCYIRARSDVPLPEPPAALLVEAIRTSAKRGI